MRITKRLTGAVVAVSVLASVGGAGAAYAAMPQEHAAVASAAVSASEDGRAIAEAVLFGSGEHADLVTPIPALAMSQEVAEGNASPEAQKTIVAVLDLIEESDPEAFEAVHAGFRSGDPYAVESSLTHLSDSAYSAISDLNETIDDGEGAPDVTPNAVVAVIALVIHVVNVVTAGNAAVFVNALAAGNVIWTENWGPKNAAGERPAELIGDLAEAFAE